MKFEKYQRKRIFKRGGISKQGPTLLYIAIRAWLKPNLDSFLATGLLTLLEKQIRKSISFTSYGKDVFSNYLFYYV